MVSNNRLIAKNTLFLYIRMFVTMLTSLFTSRIVLNILGETDFGIYNIIGGIVVLFSFLNSALLSATQRYLNFYLGKNDIETTHKVFCMSMNSYIILSILSIFIGETLGLWFVNTQLNIPESRMVAANWVYQFTLITFVINLIRVPYNATIIAYERMNFYAYLSLAEVVLKLLVVYLLYITTLDKLVVYSALYMLVPLFVTWIYKIYCNRHFDVSRYVKIWDGKMFKDLFSFSGWSLFGSLANLFANQGLNILVNIFHGVVLNSALGIANQISTAISGFIYNFQVAFNPQIVKNYAANEFVQLYNLIFRASKFSYFLLLLIALPVILNIDLILSVWLVDVPEYTGIFSQLILLFSLMDALSAPLWLFVQATGTIRNYQILMGALIFLNFPLIWIVLKLGMPVYYVWIVRILVNVVVSVARCLFIQKHFAFPLKEFCTKVLLPASYVTIIAVPLSFIVRDFFVNDWARFIISSIFSLLLMISCMGFIGLEQNERHFIVDTIRRYIPVKKS